MGILNRIIKHFRTPLTKEQYLYHAVWQGDLSLCQELVSQGADVNWQGKSGWTALMTACLRGHESIVALLLQFGAELELRTESGSTAFFIAATKRHAEVCRLLLAHGAQWDTTTNDGVRAILLLLMSEHISSEQSVRADSILDMICEHAGVDRAYLVSTLKRCSG